ncbi:hypothetical protein PIIN_08855 [Serendipita indica DSM 11827]|uniref:Uncharacterized protein n=1 Tax=Serendipita indica (strain DSM 11827) TaxID=1109443 RepID=G4TU92_SERID|nr:hypothetical protein PIIN_08855 [Serendipita indica DSM 11827]
MSGLSSVRNSQNKNIIIKDTEENKEEGSIAATNNTGKLRDIALGLQIDAKADPEPILHFPNIAHHGAVVAKFRPVLRAYMTSDYREHEVISGEVQTNMIWERDLTQLDSVLPRSLSVELAKIAAVSCKDILAAANFSDIEISFRESFFTLSAPPTLLNHTERWFDPTADLRSPFTGVLGIAIAHKKAAPVEGMGTLYICEGGECNRVSLLTARHVALPSSMHRNDLYIFDRIKSSLLRPRIRHQVLILGPQAYSNAIRDMVGKIGSEVSNLERYKRLLSQLGEAPADENVSTVSKSRRTYKERLDKAERTLVGVDALHSEITKNWTVVEQRVLGHVVYAPPISVATDPKQFTEDWALVERDCVKIDWDDFKEEKVSVAEFLQQLHPNPEDRNISPYIHDELLHLDGIVKEEDIREPTTLDERGEE